MKRILLLLLLILLVWPATAGTFDVQWLFRDSSTNVLSIKQVFIQPIAPYGVDGDTVLISGDRLSRQSDSTGSLIVSNLFNGRSYRVELVGPNFRTIFTNSFGTNVTGLVNGADPQYLTAPINDGNIVAYSRAAADARFVHIIKSNSITIATAASTLNFTNASSVSSNNGVVTIGLPSGGSGNAQTNISYLAVTNAPWVSNVTVTLNPNQFDSNASGTNIKSGALTTNLVSYGGRSNYMGSANFFDKLFPTGDATSGNVPWDFSQHIGPQTTNSENIWVWGLTRAGNVVDSRYHALDWTLEQNWDPAYPSNRKTIEYYMTWFPRSNGTSIRLENWVLEEGQWDYSKYARRISFGHPTLVNQYGVDIIIGTNSGAPTATMSVAGNVTSAGNASSGGGRFIASGRTGSSGSVAVNNPGNTANLNLYGDGAEFGQPAGDALIYASPLNVRLLAGSYFAVPTNIFGLGGSNWLRILYGSNATFSGNVTANDFISTGSSYYGNGRGLTNVSWTNLVNIPAGFADGTDDGGGGASPTFNANQFDANASATNIKSGVTITNPAIWTASYSSNTVFYVPTNAPTTAGDTLVAAVYPNSQGYTKWGFPSFATTAGTAQLADTATDFFGDGLIGPHILAPTNSYADGMVLTIQTGTNKWATPAGGGDVLTSQLNNASNVLWVANLNSTNTPTGGILTSNLFVNGKSYFKNEAWTTNGIFFDNAGNYGVNSAGDATLHVVIADIIDGTGITNVPAAQITGTLSDSQVANNITVDLATTATTANSGDSATSFFSSGTIEAARLPANSSSSDGIVTSGSGQNAKVWKTDASGNPAWRDDAIGSGSFDPTSNIVFSGSNYHSGGFSVKGPIQDSNAIPRIVFAQDGTEFLGVYPDDWGLKVYVDRSVIRSPDDTASVTLSNGGTVNIVGTLVGFPTLSGNNLYTGTETNTGSYRISGGFRMSGSSNINTINWSEPMGFLKTNSACTALESGTPVAGSRFIMVITNQVLTNWVWTLPFTAFFAGDNVSRANATINAASEYTFEFSYDGAIYRARELAGPNNLQLANYATNAYIAFLSTNAPKTVTVGITNSTTTGAKISELDYPLGVGMFYFRYAIRWGSSATATGIGFGVNYTGSSTGVNYIRTHVTGGTTAVSGVSEPNNSPTSGLLVEGMATNALSTTAFNLVNGGVRVANVYQMTIVEGFIETTTTGNLELYHNSETAAATFVGRGTKLMVWQ